MADDLFNSFMNGPDEKGRFGDFGGRFVSETLMPLILELEQQYEIAKTDETFWAEMHYLWTHYVGRPSPLYFSERLTQHLGGAKIYMKRDELNHTGAHKINNVLGQIILARRMGKSRIIAETGARRSNRDGLRQVRPAMRRLYGGPRCRASGAKRISDEITRRRSDSRDLGSWHPQRRDE